jgi:hypothetical protein
MNKGIAFTIILAVLGAVVAVGVIYYVGYIGLG